MDYPLVSILIPVYNREHLVGETIESAMAQTYNNIEIIIVDNCSTDNTWKVLEHYAALDSRIRIFKNEENIGPVRNWKRCVEKARGEYSKILFSDDLMHMEFVQSTVRILKENRDVAFVFTKVEVFNCENKRGIVFFEFGKSKKLTIKYFVKNNFLNLRITPVSPTCALFRTCDLKENLIIEIPNDHAIDFSKTGAGNDLLLFTLTIKKYKYCYFLNETFSFFRSHSGTISSNNNHTLQLSYNISRLYFLDNYYHDKTIYNTFLTFLKIKGFDNLTKNRTYRFNYLFLLIFLRFVLIHRIKKFKDLRK